MKVMEKQKTNYNEVADELVQEFREEAAQVCPGGAACCPLLLETRAAPCSLRAPRRQNPYLPRPTLFVPCSPLTSPPLLARARTQVRVAQGLSAQPGPGELMDDIRRDNPNLDERNVRRRVYDALNVLIALGIIIKHKKEIIWKGACKHERRARMLETEARTRASQSARARDARARTRALTPPLLFSLSLHSRRPAHVERGGTDGARGGGGAAPQRAAG